MNYARETLMGIFNDLGFNQNQKIVMFGRLQQRTLEQIGKIIGLSKERVRQIENRSSRMLKSYKHYGNKYNKSEFTVKNEFYARYFGIIQLNLPTRVKNALMKYGIETIDQLKLCIERDQLRGIRNIGVKNVNLIIKEVNKK